MKNVSLYYCYILLCCDIYIYYHYVLLHFVFCIVLTNIISHCITFFTLFQNYMCFFIIYVHTILLLFHVVYFFDMLYFIILHYVLWCFDVTCYYLMLHYFKHYIDTTLIHHITLKWDWSRCTYNSRGIWRGC
jgi:hypothetical protein